MYTHDEFHVHKFTAAAPDKVEMKDQNMQTENAEFKHQQVQAESRAQEQGMLRYGIKTEYLAVAVHNTLN